MKNVYFFQVSDAFSSVSKQLYLPYAVGTLAAKAWSNPLICENYVLKKIIFIRQEPESIVPQMEHPYIAAFSNYVWNFEYNLHTAAQIKKRFPDCLIVFGGHNVSPGGHLLEKYDFIDILMFGEGEEIFEKMLLTLARGENILTVPNLCVRGKDGSITDTPNVPICGTDYPSPYTMGIFDDLISENPDMRFSAILETNRGCPYHCAYCDWGPLHTKVRMFPMERVTGDIEWFADHKIDYVWGADGNFGLFPRDLRIAEQIIEAKKRTGYPQQMKVNYAKLNGSTVFELTKKFAENGLSKSTTLSLQTLSPDALHNIGRRNMRSEDYAALLSLYRNNGIPTYTELILGLPGETKDSFISGIGQILAAGQHSVIEAYDCLILPNSELADPAYRKKHEIRTVHLPYIQQHTSCANFGITEYSDIVISTASMTAWERNYCRYFAVTVQCFHSMGLLRNTAIYLHQEKHIAYEAFYTGLADYLLEHPEYSWNIFPEIYQKIHAVADAVNTQYVYDKRFGDVFWPMDEGAFLQIITHPDHFFSDISAFISSFSPEDPVLSELLSYQKSVIRIPVPAKTKTVFSYNFTDYFREAYKNTPIPLKKQDCSVDASGLLEYADFADYAREIVWYGRRSQRTSLIE